MDYPIYIERHTALPLVDIQLALRTGADQDPKDKLGLMWIMCRMLRMGTATMQGLAVEEGIACLGARLSIEVNYSVVRFQGTVIRRNLEPFMILLGQLLTVPAFRFEDLALVKRELLADLSANSDSDAALVARQFRRVLFDTHAYGRLITGTTSTIPAITPEDLRNHHAQHLRCANIVLGAAGDIDRDTLTQLCEKHWQAIPSGKSRRVAVRAPKSLSGRHGVLVDKPARSQTQLMIGTLGARVQDDDLDALNLANTVFGGTFSSRLMAEVRSKRGWSYGASSSVGSDRQRDAWSMHTFPATADAVDCALLQLELLEAWVAHGINDRERRAARDYLINSYCFDVDTAAKRLDDVMDIALFGLHRDYYQSYTKRVKSINCAQANQAVRSRIGPQDLCIVMVASASDVADDFAKIPGLKSLTVIPHDRVFV